MLTLSIFVVQLVLFTMLALWLHRLSEYYGLTPLLFFIAGIVGVLNIIELNMLFIEPVPGTDIVLRPGGHIYIPLILASVLVLYVVNGTYPARITLFGIIAINLLILVILGFLLAYTTFVSPGTEISGGLAYSQVLTGIFIRGMVASLIAFFVDMFVIIIVYQGTQNFLHRLPDWIIPGLALLLALWTDSALFNLLAYLGTDRFVLEIPGDIVMKTAAGLIIWPMAAFYLLRIAPTLPDYQGSNGRGTFDIIKPAPDPAMVQTLKHDLQTSRAIYQQLTQHIEEIFWLIDTNKQRFLYLSPAFERITGRSAEPYYQDAEQLGDLLHPADKPADDEMSFVDFLITSPPGDFRLRDIHGNYRWLRNRSFPITDDSGQALRYAGVLEDITDHKRATERALRLVVAEEKMRVLHDFIRDASHDLKTPLSAMMLKVNLLERVNDPRKRLQLQDEIHERATYLSRLIDDLFELSQIQGGTDRIIDTIDLNDIVRDVKRDSAPLAEEKHLTFMLDLTDDDTTLKGNAQELKRAVTNLVGNAIRYTPQGRITVRTRSNNDRVFLSVQDTGIGIKPEAQDHIFERFFRTEAARTSEEQGTGLGLAIVRAILDHHGGGIRVESDGHVGTTFELWLPRQPHDPDVYIDSRRIEQEFPVLPD
jgi:PAS domain S-box-containing protein